MNGKTLVTGGPVAMTPPSSVPLSFLTAAAVGRALPQFPVRVEIVWDPPWTPDRMNPDAAMALGLGRTLRILRREDV